MHLTLVFPRLKTFSGAENLLLELSHFAVGKGHAVTVVTRRVDEACQQLFDPRVDVRVAASPFCWLSGNHLVDSFFDTALSLALVSHIPHHTDVICFLCPPVLPAMAWLRRRRRVPVAYYCLQPPRFAYDLTWETVKANGLLGYLVPLVAPLYRRLDRQLAPRCDRMMAISQDYMEWCRQLYRPRHLQLVYPGIDPDRAQGGDADVARRKIGVEQGRPLVMTANKLIVRKNVDVFLHAMALVVERFPEARGVVVGDGPMRQPLLALRKRMGLEEQVLFTGFLPDYREVSDFFAACDIYVFLEKFVPFGLTVLEAGACGKPVVTVERGGTRDTVVPGETGFMVPDDPIRPEAVAQRICQLLEDEELRKSMGEKGRENAWRFSFEQTSGRFVEVLESLAMEAA